MEFPKKLLLPGRRSSLGSLGLGTETLMDAQSHSRTVGCGAQKKTLGCVVVDKEQRNKLLKNLCHRTWYKDPGAG